MLESIATSAPSRTAFFPLDLSLRELLVLCVLDGVRDSMEGAKSHDGRELLYPAPTSLHPLSLGTPLQCRVPVLLALSGQQY